MVTKTPIKVRYAETDKMGIVHHSNYAVWYEAARGDFIEAMGMRYSDMEESGVMVPLVERVFDTCKLNNPPQTA